MTVRGLENGQRCALILGECQRGAMDTSVAGMGGLAEIAEKRGIVGKIKILAEFCRARDIPVIHGTKIGRADGGGTFANSLYASVSKKGRMGPDREVKTQIHPELTPHDEDYVVPRLHGFSMFHGTELESILRSLKVETVIMVGVSTNLNLPGSSLEAVNRGFTVVLPEDCTAGISAETHEFFLKEFIRLLATITTSENVMATLAAR